MNKSIIKGSFGFLLLSVALYSCKSTQEVTKQKETVGINVSYMDKSVNPADDFNRYVNGAWLDKTEIPSDRTRWGSFDELRKNTDDDVMAILKEAINDKTIDPNSDQAKAISLYKTVLDTVSRNKAGIDPLKPYLAKINNVQNADQLIALLSEMEPEMGLGFFGSYIGADAKNSNRNVIYVGTGSLGLPDRDYYVSDAPDNKEKREKYVAHITRMLQYIGESEATANANA
ncbi:MAG: M13 family metallopeptidase, partial [Flavobacterium sp.]|nr:M13 family metallopeptidase [Flavobacterium sp.]